MQDGGSDWRIWRVMEIESGKVLDDELRWIKFNTPDWTTDGAGFFYARFPEPEAGADFQSLNLNQQVFYHRVGRPQAEDVLVFRRPDQPEWGYHCTVTDDGRYLLITVSLGTDDKYRIYYKDLSEPYGMPQALVDTFDHEFSFIGNDGPVFFFRTDIDAPKKRVIAVDTRAARELFSAEPQATVPPFTEIISEQPDVMSDVSLVGNLLLVESLHDAVTQVSLYTLGPARAEHRVSGTRLGERVQGQTDRHGDVLLVRQLHHAPQFVSLRPRHRREHAAAVGGRGL